MKDIVLLLIGAVVGLLLNEVYRWTGLDKKLEKIVRRLRRKPLPRNRRESTFLLGNQDTNTCIIDGDGAQNFPVSGISIRLTKQELSVPESLAAKLKEIEEQESRKKESGLPSAWNGRMAHMTAFSVGREPNEETGSLSITMGVAQYFHYMITNAALYQSFRCESFASQIRKDFLGNFNEWRTKPVPNLVNGVAVNLFIFTDDDMMVFAKRSNAVAIAPGEVTFTINENVHPDHDRFGNGDQLDPQILLRRALREELGWEDNSNSGSCAEVHIIGFAVHTGTGGYGLLGYASLPISYPELQLKFAMKARDRHEIDHLIPLPLRAETIAGFIHHQTLYNFVGVGAAMALHHKMAIPFEKLEVALRGLQG